MRLIFHDLSCVSRFCETFFGQKSMDSITENHRSTRQSSTLGGRSSGAPAGLGMLKQCHVFNTYSARSHDSRGHYIARIAPRGQKPSEKVGCFAYFLPGPAGGRAVLS